jgi:cytochrome c556
MKRRSVFLFLGGFAFLLGTFAPATHGQGGYNKAAFEKSMEDANKNARVLLGALIAEDWAKAETTAGALAEASKSIAKLTPKVGADRMAEFTASADSLGSRAARVALAAKAKDGQRSATALGEMVASCTGCHASFRK